MSSLILAIDQGTTSSRALLFRPDTSIAGLAQAEFPQHFPASGWVEHEPEDLWRTTLDTCRAAMRQAGVTAGDVAAIGITNQRETVVVWDRATGQPLGRAIVWQDRRTADRCAALAPQAAAIARATGLVTDPYFSATKLEWILQHRVGGRAGGAEGLLAGTIDTWLIWKLTNGAVHATDPTNASRTMLYDIDRGAWSDQLLTLFGVPREWMPEVRASSGDFGVTAAEHFGAAIPITGVAGDQQAALFGQGCWHAGTSKNTYGTGAFLLLHTGAARPAGGVFTRASTTSATNRV